MKNKLLEIKRGYKVVRKVNNPGLYKSYWADDLYNEVEYQKNVWCFPNIGSGPLAVFNTLYDMQLFLGMDKSVEIVKMFSCLYVPNYFQNKLWLRRQSLRSSHIIEVLYDRDLPTGTVLASQVKLLEEI